MQVPPRMTFTTLDIIKTCIYISLLIFYWQIYLRTAIAQYKKGSTTMSERIQQMEKITNPVFIICPELGFQPSYFKNFDFTHYTGISSFVWKFPWFSQAVLANESIP